MGPRSAELSRTSGHQTVDDKWARLTLSCPLNSSSRPARTPKLMRHCSPLPFTLFLLQTTASRTGAGAGLSSLSVPALCFTTALSFSGAALLSLVTACKLKASVPLHRGPALWPGSGQAGLLAGRGPGAENAGQSEVSGPQASCFSVSASVSCGLCFVTFALSSFSFQKWLMDHSTVYSSRLRFQPLMAQGFLPGDCSSGLGWVSRGATCHMATESPPAFIQTASVPQLFRQWDPSLEAALASLPDLRTLHTLSLSRV